MLRQMGTKDRLGVTLGQQTFRISGSQSWKELRIFGLWALSGFEFRARDGLGSGSGFPNLPSSLSEVKSLVILVTQAFMQTGPGLFGLLAHVVRAQH